MVVTALEYLTARAENRQPALKYSQVARTGLGGTICRSCCAQALRGMWELFTIDGPKRRHLINANTQPPITPYVPKPRGQQPAQQQQQQQQQYQQYQQYPPQQQYPPAQQYQPQQQYQPPQQPYR